MLCYNRRIERSGAEYSRIPAVCVFGQMHERNADEAGVIFSFIWILEKDDA